MPRLPRITSRRLIRVLLKAGFYLHHQTGSHINLRHHEKVHLRIVVPQHSGDLAPKTIKSIIVQAEMTVEEFVALL
jgi:predicted RNA binding protein YcfA (HicA-like mRNA interferase family)